MKKRISVTTAMKEISKMKTKQEIINYCDKLKKDGYFSFTRGGESKACYDGTESLAEILTSINGLKTLDDLPEEENNNYILMCREDERDEDEDSSDSGTIPDFYYFGVNFVDKTVTKYTYSQWDDGDERDITDDMTLDLSI